MVPDALEAWGRMAGMDTLKTYDVVLLPSMEQAVAYRKAAALKGNSLLGVTVSTFGAWAADLWELYGDGRALASKLQRDLLLRSVCERGCDGVEIRRGDADCGSAAECGADAPCEGADVDFRGCAESVPGACAPARGFDRVAAECVEAAAGLPAFEAAVAAAARGERAGEGALAGVVASEVAVLRAVAGYYERLETLGLIELGQALAALGQAMPPRPMRVLLENAAPLSAAQQAFFAACPWMDVEVHAAGGSEGPTRAPEGVRVRFAFPSGQYALPALLADVVREAAGEGSPICSDDCVSASSAIAYSEVELEGGQGNGGEYAPRLAGTDVDGGDKGSALRAGCGQAACVVVAAKDPASLFAQVVGAFSRERLVCALRARRRFVDTDFGRALLSLRRFRCDEAGAAHIGGYGDIASSDVERWCRADLADWALSPFSGLSKKAAFSLDADVRADRTIGREAMCERLRRDSALFSPMERMARALDADAAAELEAAVMRMTNRAEAWRAEQLAALRACRQVAEAAQLADAGPEAAFEQLQRMQVDASRIVAPRGVDAAGLAYPDVLVCDQATAAGLAPGACEVLVVTDLTSAAYPAADRETAASALLEKLGASRTDSTLSRLRRAFSALERLPRRELVLERCLNDASAEPTYPCVVLEEFVDCYRADLTATDDIDNAYSLPEKLQVGMLLRGEDLLLENERIGASAQVAARVELPSTGELSDAARSLVVLPRVLQGGEVLREPCLSPSQIESYLECPYKWFAQRRLRLDDLDEGFGPLEMGDFAHNVLHSFYTHFSEDLGFSKVTAENMGQARELMADVLRRHKALQPHLRTSVNRLIPTSELERRELAELERKLMTYLDFEAKLLPTFAPAYLEYDVACGGAVEYAGRKLLGTADRIDVDDQGRCVVIDYKGSLSSAYALSAREGAYLGKVQALIYAQVVRRTLGLEPVGALYVCYGRVKRATGAYDGRVLENAHLPNMRHKDCMCADRAFAEVLDETEEAVATALERMLAGDIAPRPATPEACKWCPVTSCSKRKG